MYKRMFAKLKESCQLLGENNEHSGAKVHKYLNRNRSLLVIGYRNQRHLIEGLEN